MGALHSTHLWQWRWLEHWSWWQHFPFRGGAGRDEAIDSACNDLATCTSLQNDQGVSNSDNSSECGGEDETWHKRITGASLDMQLSVDVLVTIELMGLEICFFSVEASAACALKLRKSRSS